MKKDREKLAVGSLTLENQQNQVAHTHFLAPRCHPALMEAELLDLMEGQGQTQNRKFQAQFRTRILRSRTRPRRSIRIRE